MVERETGTGRVPHHDPGADTERTAPRNIVLLSDGTGNSAGSLFKTNVRRLYESLDLEDPKDFKYPRQFAYYDDGVGTSAFRPIAILGGAFGFGLARNVRDIYAFLCRTYRPGDRIYAFGFSRGAFTIRVVVGLVVNQGILAHDGSEAALQRNVRAAFRAYRRERYGSRPLTALWRAVRDPVADLVWRLTGHPAYDTLARYRVGRPGDPLAAGRGSIEFVGVWDTVDAYGLPIEELTRAVDTIVLPLTMPDADLAPEVRRARHALSLDDQRNTFHPRLWNEDTEADRADPGRIRQVWFAGVHADVGGGYPDDGLAHVTLRWMADEAEAAVPGEARLRFVEEIRRRQRALADENAPLHDSRRGLASYYRYKPRRVAALVGQGASFVQARWDRFKALMRGQVAPDGRDRHRVVAEPIIHQSVLRRIQTAQDGYAPVSLPPTFKVYPVDADPASGCGARSQGQQVPELEAGEAHLWDDRADQTYKAAFAERAEQVWNFVWWRRIAYFVTLLGTLFLASVPLWADVGPCSSWACATAPLISGLGYALPSAASTWTEVFASNPQTFLLGAAVIAVGFALGKNLDTRIPDEMRRLLYRTSLRPPRPGGMTAFLQPSSRGRINRAVQWLRLSKGYEPFWDVVRRLIIPGVAFASALLLFLGGLNATLLSVRESVGSACGAEELTKAGTVFGTDSVCHLAQAGISPGATYRLRVTVRSEWTRTAIWSGRAMPVTPNGVVPGQEATAMAALVPFRRHIREPWLKLMVRIGTRGTDVHSPDWRLLPAAPGAGATYEAVVRTHRRGTLYLYVNEVAPVFGIDHFYAGYNAGKADLEVTLVDMSNP